MRVPLAVVGLGRTEIQAAIEVFESGNLTMGEQVRTFESLMASFLGADHFIMVNSGSSANLLIFEYLLRPSSGKPLLKIGDGVLVPAIAWPTTIWPIIQLGLIPVFVDVNRDTFDINLESARNAISLSNVPVKAIFPIHPLGYAINPRELSSFSKEFSIVLVNDVCESLGSWSEGLHAGMEGLAASFSFYFSHHITTMEGGGIATNSLEIADDLRSMRSHGWSRDRSDGTLLTKGLSTADSKFRFFTTGYNVRPTEIQAAIGINQITKIHDYVNRRREIARKVAKAVKNTPLKIMGGVDFANSNTTDRHSWMMIALCVEAGLEVKLRVQEFLEQSGVETRPVLTGNFLHQPAMKNIEYFIRDVSLRNTDWVAEHCFLIGAHHDFTEDQINHLVNTLTKVANLVE